MFNIGDWLISIPGGFRVEVEGVNQDFIVVIDSAGEAHTVMPEDYDKYEKAE